MGIIKQNEITMPSRYAAGFFALGKMKLCPAVRETLKIFGVPMTYEQILFKLRPYKNSLDIELDPRRLQKYLYGMASKNRQIIKKAKNDAGKTVFFL